MAKHKYVIYKIFYDSPDGEFIAYLGRTKQPINARLNGHFFQKLDGDLCKYDLESGNWIPIE